MSVVEDSMVGVGVPKLLIKLKTQTELNCKHCPLCAFSICVKNSVHIHGCWLLHIVSYILSLGQETKERMGNALVQPQSHPIQNCRI